LYDPRKGNGHGTNMMENKNSCIYLAGNMKEGDCLEDPGIDVRIILKLLFKKWDGWVWTGFIWVL
jgi:hypothetical protein